MEEGPMLRSERHYREYREALAAWNRSLLWIAIGALAIGAFGFALRAVGRQPLSVARIAFDAVLYAAGATIAHVAMRLWHFAKLEKRQDKESLEAFQKEIQK